MEDASAEQAARFFRRIEYLSVIGTIAPMLGLLGTVWGMMLAFLEFKAKANVQAADLAPGIAHALVTTFIGLVVAIPAFAAFAYFRNRIDELVAASAQLAEHVFADYRRNQALRRRKKQTGTSNPAAARPPVPPVTYNVPSLGKPDAARPPIPSVTIEKGKIERDKTG